MTDYVQAIRYLKGDPKFLLLIDGEDTDYDAVKPHPDNPDQVKPSQADSDTAWDDGSVSTWWDGEESKFSAEQNLYVSDVGADYVRVLEDLIDLLDANGTIDITDLPVEAQQKHQARKDARDTLNG